jgi:hypothetical protein
LVRPKDKLDIVIVLLFNFNQETNYEPFECMRLFMVGVDAIKSLELGTDSSMKIVKGRLQIFFNVKKSNYY